EDPLAVAMREFEEETGQPAPTVEYVDLGDFKRKDGKISRAWAVEGDIDAAATTSNTFEIEWPPKSGQMQNFPEVDKAAWFPLETVASKMHHGQPIFLERLAEKLGVEYGEITQQQLL